MSQALAANRKNYQNAIIETGTGDRIEKTSPHSHRAEKLYQIVYGNHTKNKSLRNCSLPHWMQLKNQSSEIFVETACEHAVEAEAGTFN